MTKPISATPSQLLLSYTRSLVDLLNHMSLADRELLLPLLVQHLAGVQAVGFDAMAWPQSHQPEGLGDGLVEAVQEGVAGCLPAPNDEDGQRVR